MTTTATEYRSPGDQFTDLLNGRGDFEGLADRISPQLDRIFPGADREVIESRLNGFFDRYLSERYGMGSSKPKATSKRARGNPAALAMVDALGSRINRRIEGLRAQLAANRPATKQAGDIGETLAKFGGSLDKRIDELKALCGQPLAAISPLARQAKPTVAKVTDENLRGEYAQNRSIHQQLGVTEAKFIARRRRELAEQAAKR